MTSPNRTAPRANPRLVDIVPYDPKYLPAEAMLSANENPRNVPDVVLRDIVSRVRTIEFNRYPDPLANDLRDAIAEANGLDRDCVLTGNGGDELLFDTALAWGGTGRTFLNLPPTFSVYQNNAQLTGTAIVDIERLADFSIDEAAVLERMGRGDIDFTIIASPNNPTGRLASEEFLVRLLESTDALVMVDEAYFEFSRFTMRPYLERFPNLVLLRTFSKAFSLAGVRMGYILADPAVIREYLKVRQPYSVDAVSQAIALSVFEHRSEFEPGIDAIVEQRDVLYRGLCAMPRVQVFPSDSNYILFRVDDAAAVWRKLFDAGMLIRDLSSGPLTRDCLRVSVGSVEQNRAFLDALSEIVEG